MKIIFDGKYTIIDFGCVMFVFDALDWIIMAILTITLICALLIGF